MLIEKNQTTYINQRANSHRTSNAFALLSNRTVIMEHGTARKTSVKASAQRIRASDLLPTAVAHLSHVVHNSRILEQMIQIVNKSQDQKPRNKF